MKRKDECLYCDEEIVARNRLTSIIRFQVHAFREHGDELHQEGDEAVGELHWAVFSVVFAAGTAYALLSGWSYLWIILLGWFTMGSAFTGYVEYRSEDMALEADEPVS